MNYWTYLIIIVLLTLIPQILVSTTYNKYSNVKSKIGKNGLEVVGEMLKQNNVEDVRIVEIEGTLTDHYDPRSKKIALSRDNFRDPTVASIAVAAHETGHAIQDNKGYFFLRLRQLMGPITITANKFSWIAIYLGFIFWNSTLIWIGIALLSITILFSLVTLPVELNASRRAKQYLASIGEYSSEELKGVSRVLTAAAFTYVASALAGILQLIRLIAIARDD